MSDVSLQWMKLITERTDGAITFDETWSGALGSGPEIIEKLEMGSIDVLTPSSITYAGSKWPLASLQFTFPFGPTDTKIVLGTFQQLWSEYYQLDRDMARYNAKRMVTITNPAYMIMSLEPLASLSDLNGVKFGIWGKYFGRWLAPAGGVPVATPSYERYEMLRTNVIQANILPTIEHYGVNIRDLCKYRTSLGLTAHAVWTVIMRDNLFQSLEPEAQKIIWDTSMEIEQAAIDTILPHWENDIVFPAWEEAGVELIDFPDSDVAEWAELVDDIPREYAEEMEAMDYASYDIVARYQEISAELGHNWPKVWGAK